MRRWVFLILALAAAAGCSQSQTAPNAPAALAPPSMTDTFSGTLIAFGSNLHTFAVSQLGEVDITLQATTLQPTVDAATGESIPPEIRQATFPLTPTGIPPGP